MKRFRCPGLIVFQTIFVLPLHAQPAAPASLPSEPTEIRRADSATKENPFINSLGMKFVPVPGADVLFSVWETRVRDYQEYVKTRQISWNRPDYSQTPDHPAVNVSWDDAQAFCLWLTQRELAEAKLKPGQRYELPGDVAWSRAVGLESEAGDTPRDRDGKTPGIYPWGRSMPPIVNGAPMGNYADAALKRAESVRRVIDSYDDGVVKTAPVGKFPANAFGLHDLGGNVWEWCADFYDGQSGPRLLRGAAWYIYDPSYLLSSLRISKVPGARTGMIGFRCVLVAGPRP